MKNFILLLLARNRVTHSLTGHMDAYTEEIVCKLAKIFQLPTLRK